MNPLKLRRARRQYRETGQAACTYCWAPRVDGIRTCGPQCLRGVDLRLAEFLGVPSWMVSGKRVGA